MDLVSFPVFFKILHSSWSIGIEVRDITFSFVDGARNSCYGWGNACDKQSIMSAKLNDWKNWLIVTSLAWTTISGAEKWIIGCVCRAMKASRQVCELILARAIYLSSLFLFCYIFSLSFLWSRIALLQFWWGSELDVWLKSSLFSLVRSLVTPQINNHQSKVLFGWWLSLRSNLMPSKGN